MTEVYIGINFALLVGILIMLYRYDRIKAEQEMRTAFIQAHMHKALRDRRHKTSIDTTELEKVFKTGVETLPDPRQFNQKPGLHPALRRRK